MTIFTPELLASFDDSIVDVADALTMPPSIYTSEEFLHVEKREALFAKEWLCVGRASRIPNVGDYFTVTLNNEPLIITRAKDESVRAFSAICQHRGMQVAEGEGNCTKFTCLYHLWSFDLTGRLLGAPAMERTNNFNKKDYPLPPLKVELWQGFIFVHFDLDAPPLAPTLERYTPYLANYELKHTVCPGTFTLTDLPWNWKVMFENFNDGYHANKLHHTIQDFCPSELAAFPVPWNDDSNVIFRTNGYIHIDGGFNATTKALMPIYPNLTEEERQRSTFALMPPTLCFGTAPDQAFFFIITPKTAGTIDVEIGYLFHPTALENPMFDYLYKMSDAGVQVFVQQDQDATMKVQRGMNSRFAARGRYSWQEESHVQFNRWLVKRYQQQWPSAETAGNCVTVLDLPPVSAIADVLKLWGIDGWLTPPLRGVVPSATPVLGAAATVSIASAASGPGLAPVYSLLSGALDQRFVVVAGAATVGGAVWGEIMSTAASAAGASGVLVDGSVRDAGEMASIGLPVYATDECVVGPNGTAHAIEVGGTVTIGEVEIADGDAVVADQTGVVRIPHEQVNDVLRAARAYAAAEDRVVQALVAGEPLTSAYLHKKCVVDELRR